MDPSQSLPPFPSQQPSQPPARVQTPSSGSEHVDSGGHSPTEKLLVGGSATPSPPRDPIVGHSLQPAGEQADREPYPPIERPLTGSSGEHISPHDRRVMSQPELNLNPQTPAPARSRDGHMHLLTRGLSRRHPSTSGLDYLVPVIEKPHLRTLGQRLAPTIENARTERDKYSIKAQWTGYALNIAIGLQVILGALTTGISAALGNNPHIGIAISLLGGMTTLVASYLARARGSNEPELSITRVKDLDHFLRDCEAFVMDYGHQYGTPELDIRLNELRRRFEELLGNADGQRKLSPPV